MNQITSNEFLNLDFEKSKWNNVFFKQDENIIINTEEIEENKSKIKNILSYFDIPVSDIETIVGPTFTSYEVIPDKGARISKIKDLKYDIAAWFDGDIIRVIPPVLGKGPNFRIEIVNKNITKVGIGNMINSDEFKNTKFELPIIIGKTVDNEIYISDLAKMPHLLIGGATGQGKSMAINSIIVSLLCSKKPDELKLVLIDPKMVELGLYCKIEKQYLAKHLKLEDSIITDSEDAVLTLNSLCIEMDNRYQLLKDSNSRNIVEYNEKIEGKITKNNEASKKLSYIVVIIDEYADLILQYGKKIEMPIARLAQKSRAVGIHVILATQRPSYNVVTGIIKANFPSRMAFRVGSGIDSKTIIDMNGAQYLNGKGDLLISDNQQITRVQGAYIDINEIDELCSLISESHESAEVYKLPDEI